MNQSMQVLLFNKKDCPQNQVSLKCFLVSSCVESYIDINANLENYAVCLIYLSLTFFPFGMKYISLPDDFFSIGKCGPPWPE